MSNWLLVVYRDWLVHIVHRLKLELLKQRYLHIDETHVQVLKEPGTEKYVRFLYVGLLQHQRCRKSHPLLRVPAGTKRKYPEAFLREYEGYIHTDAYPDTMQFQE